MFSYYACAIASEVIKEFKIDFIIQFLNMEISKISNLKTICAQLSDFRPYDAKLKITENASLGI